YSELEAPAGGAVASARGPYASLFSHFQPYYYWSGTPVHGKTDSRESFSFGSGYRSDNSHTNFMFVIPVYGGSLQTLTSTADDGPGSLRDAAEAARAGDTIEFSPDLAHTTITVSTAVSVSKPLYIVGRGADGLTLSADNDARVFDVVPGVAGATIAYLT